MKKCFSEIQCVVYNCTTSYAKDFLYRLNWLLFGQVFADFKYLDPWIKEDSSNMKKCTYLGLKVCRKNEIF